jgi:hypothetical protein
MPREGHCRKYLQAGTVTRGQCRARVSLRNWKALFGVTKALIHSLRNSAPLLTAFPADQPAKSKNKASEFRSEREKRRFAGNNASEFR